MKLVPLLSAKNVTKSFGSFAALKNVCFEVYPGEIHALCGENGAGKSTLMKILSGHYAFGSYGGEVRIGSELARFAGVRDSECEGIAIVHQELSLIDSLSVAENLLLRCFPQRHWRINWPETFREAQRILNHFGVSIEPDTMVSLLGIGQQQMVEIARVLSKQPKILILDEPTAALTEIEIKALLEEVRRLREHNVACIYISHKLDEVRRIADRITVLRDGRTISTKPTTAYPVQDIIHDMVGREIEDIYPPKQASRSEHILLSVENLSALNKTDHHVELENISLAVRSGEIVGIGGLMGSGRSELLMHLYGMWGHQIQGSVSIKGVPYNKRSPSLSTNRGIAFVPEDRKRFGLIPDGSIHLNLSLTALSRKLPLMTIDRVGESQKNRELLSKLHFRTLNTEAEVRQLSGGNQQKVVLGRGLLTDPEIVLLDEPTRGVDVGARAEIYEEIAMLARDGRAILMVSSELPELIGMCHRVLMMHQGKVTSSFLAHEFNQGQMLAAALGKN